MSVELALVVNHPSSFSEGSKRMMGDADWLS